MFFKNLIPFDRETQRKFIFRINHRSKSGRIKNIEFKHLIYFILFFIFPLTAICFLTIFYTPLLHYLGGDDELMRINSKNLKTKITQEFKAGLINPWVVKSPPLVSGMPTIRIFVNENKYMSLDKEILKYGFGEYKKKPKIRGFYESENKQLIPIKFGYRGRNSWHHQYWKPSLHLKFKKGTLINGYRRHLLLAPEDGIGMRNWLSQKLARDWEMLTYQEEFVRLYLNGHYKGLYTRYYPMDESLLIHHNKLPGPFLRQEIGKGPVFKKIYFPFFETSSFDIEGAEGSEGLEAAQNLIDAIQQMDAKQQVLALNKFFDPEAMVKFLVLFCHASSDHYFLHNIAYWQDKTTGLFVPIPVDVNGYGMFFRGGTYDETQPIVTGNHYTKRWQQDPRNLARFIDSLYSFTLNMGSKESVHRIIDSTWRIIKPELEADFFTSDLGTKSKISFRTPMALTDIEGDKNLIKKFIEVRNENIKNQLISDSIYLTHETEDSVEIMIKGNAGVYAQYKNKINEDPKLLLPTYSFIENQVFAFFTLPGSIIDYEFKHRLTKKNIPVLKLGWHKYYLKKTQGLHISEFDPPPLKEEIILGPGKIVVNKDTRYHKNTMVTIRPNTYIEIAPNKSLFFEGSIQIRGTQERPVVVRPKDNNNPFGIFAIVGKGDYITHIDHFDIEGGSVYKHLNIYFSGMFSIRDRENVVIKNSVFGQNFKGDDGVHLVRSSVEVTNSHFNNSRSDAVDFDKVIGKLENNLFTNCGNDCFDISMSTIESIHNQFLICADKCISVGENSKIHIDASIFSNGSNGVAIKDKSKALIVNSTFEHCDTSVNAFNKKWRWEVGGTGYMKNLNFHRSLTLDVFTGRRSKIFFLNKVPPLASNLKSKRIKALKPGEFPRWEVL